MIRIGIDARVLCSAERRGAAQYLYRLLRALLEISDGEEYHLLVDGPINPLNEIRHPRVLVKRVPRVPGYRLDSWLHLRLPMHVARHRYDLVLYAYNVLPVLRPTPSVVSVLDVKIFRKRQTLLGQDSTDGGRYLPSAIRGAERVMFISGFTRDETEQDTGPLPNARVIHLGISEIYDRVEQSAEDVQRLKARYGLRDRFLMAFGAAMKYKNTDFLVRSFLRVRDRLPGNYQLLLAGCQVLESADYAQTVRAARAEADVVCFGFVPDQDLVALYGATDCFVYPSLYEGFGFPPLEAMACGAPVLSSNLSAMPEIVGSFCELADPTDEKGFDAALLGFLTRLRDSDYRSKLTAGAYEHARGFTWRRTAEQTLRVFHEAAGLA